MSYAYVHTPRYDAGVREWMTDPRAMSQLHETLSELARQPFKNPLLQTHRMKSRSDRKIYITDVDGRKGWRLIWNLIDRTIVLLLFGEHDKVERQAERIDYQADDVTGVVTLVEYVTRDDTPRQHPTSGPADDPGQLFMAWTDDELAGFGFTDAQVVHLRRLDDLDDLDTLAPKLGDEAYERALKLAIYHSPEGDELEQRTDRREAEELVRTAQATAEEKVLAEQITAPKSRESFAVVPADQLADVLSKPIEDWMVFLHPDQLKLTQRPFSGPARVRGAAGTGKTVVAMHRTKHLARTYPGQRILFTTYVNNLPAVFETLFARFAPDEAPQVDFLNIHKWASRFLKAQGRPYLVDAAAMNRAFRSAWNWLPADGPVRSSGHGDGYYREELDWVIKGRGLRTLDNYLQLPRSGRGTPLPAAHREEVWRLYERYQTNLRTAGTIDFADLLLHTLDLAEQGAVDDHYAAVVIDEAQDLTEVGIRLLHRLAGGDRRDGLFLVGDGQQSVYPGGFSLGSVGIDVRGRSTLLKTNYRNTRQILATAASIVADAAFDDLEETFEHGRRTVTVTRDGDPPTLAGYDTVDDHDEALVLALSTTADRSGVDLGDIAVLLPTNRMVKQYEATIRSLGLATQMLTKYDGQPTSAVKVGTFQRAKGLEFKHVFLPRLEPESLGETQRHNEDADTHAERLELLRRQLFVAMTRARDGVWGGWVRTRPGLLGGTP